MNLFPPIFPASEAALLLSMTGFGEARRQDDSLTVSAEVRTVNNRHLKLSLRASDPYGALEPEFEKLVKDRVRRGSVQLSIRVERPKSPSDYRLNLVALAGYRDSLREFAGPDAKPPEVADLLRLPGVVEENRSKETDTDADWPTVAGVVVEALERLQEARAIEGRAMAEELLALGDGFAEHLAAVADRAPEIASEFEGRLLERVQKLLRDRAEIEPSHLIREVALFAERADVAEEITRLRAHLDLYRSVIAEPESAGRKLEFVVQEMGRETNTIGSKASDVAVSRSVVEMKGILERVRELIQNVE